MGNRVLIIEDDAAIAEAVKLNLECADYTVVVFDNGLTVRDALEAELRDILAGERGCWRRGRIGPGAWAAGSLPATAH